MIKIIIKAEYSLGVLDKILIVLRKRLISYEEVYFKIKPLDWEDRKLGSQDIKLNNLSEENNLPKSDIQYQSNIVDKKVNDKNKILNSDLEEKEMIKDDGKDCLIVIALGEKYQSNILQIQNQIKKVIEVYEVFVEIDSERNIERFNTKEEDSSFSFKDIKAEYGTKRTDSLTTSDIHLERKNIQKIPITTDKAPKPVGPYSVGIVFNGLIYLSGQIAINPKTNIFVHGSVLQQFKLIFSNINVILNEAGSDLAKIIKVEIFLKDIKSFSAINEEYKKIFENSSNPYPARTTIEVSHLPLNADIEIGIIAHL